MDLDLLAYAILSLTSSVYYLSYSVATLAIVGLVGYYVALKKARA